MLLYNRPYVNLEAGVTPIMPHSHTSHHHHKAELLHAAGRNRMLRAVTITAIAISVLLMLIKLGAWTMTHATSLLSSLAESLSDILMSWVNFFAIRYASKPADDDHRFGHNSMEDIAGLFQFAVICGSMLFIAAQALEDVIHGSSIREPEYGIWVMIISLVLTTILVIYQRYVFKRTGSLIIKADSLHYVGDILTCLAIIGSLLAAYIFEIYWLDPILALGIAAYIIIEARHIGLRAFNNLMDHEMPDDEKTKIIEALIEFPEVLGHHNLKTRYSGAKPFIQMHVELRKDLTFQQAHEITEQLEKKLESLFHEADVILHQDPV